MRERVEELFEFVAGVAFVVEDVVLDFLDFFPFSDFELLSMQRKTNIKKNDNVDRSSYFLIVQDSLMNLDLFE